MAEASKLKPCTYFLVQYVPDVVRGEFLNIGVFLHSPEVNFLGCHFTHDFQRIKRFHPQADTELLRELQPHFDRQIKEHGRDLDGYIREMQESFSNLIQVTPPRTCLVAEPQATMMDLFERYVEQRLAGRVPQDARLRIKQRLTAALRRSGVLGHRLFEKRVPAKRWTHEGDPFCFDFGYRPFQVGGKPNGRFKFIHAYYSRRDPERELVKALRLTFDWVLKKERAELTVGHEDLSSPVDPVTRAWQAILEDERIHLVPASRFDEYAESVRRELTP